MTSCSSQISIDPALSEASDSVLTTSGWLSERPIPIQAAVLAAGRPVRFGDGETLYNVGDAPNGLFGLISGTVQIEIPGDQEESVVIHQATPGFWVGDLALFASQARLIGVAARGEVVAFYVPGEKLRTMVREMPEFIEDLYALTHRNTATALRLLANLSVARSGQRIALRLLHQDELAAASEGWILLSQEDLAMFTAVSLPTLQRVLRRLSDSGLIEIGYGKLRVLDRPGLKAEAAR